MKTLRIALGITFMLLISLSVSAEKINSKNALDAYMNNGDKSFKWEVLDSLKGDRFTAYQLKMTAQVWRNIPWIHEMTIFIPDNLKNDIALIHVTGGSCDESNEPRLHKWTEGLISTMGVMAVKNQTVTSIIWQIPRQPLYGGKTEDELISYTYHQFQLDGDYTWPLLFPMAKSAVKGMDAVQQFVSSKHKTEVKGFIMNGASKRGWTTWMAAATGDKRLVAIAPMVIDILNMPVNVPYQVDMFGGYSIQIKDYVDLGLTEVMTNEKGKELVDMIDPYSYREKYTMPKMLFMGTNDEYWTVDAVKNYIDDIPGEKFICYTPNAGHNLGGAKEAMHALSAFLNQTINGKKYPECSYSLEEKGGKISVNIKADETLLEDVIVWYANSENKDFRKKLFIFDRKGISKQKNFTVNIDYPKKGFKAFYVALKYASPVDESYYVATRMYTADPSNVFVKPFDPNKK